MNELTIGDKIYVSSKRAAEITGYAKDYIGQLCREGHVEAKMVGRSWYVLESSIREHRFGKQEEKISEPVQIPSAPEVSAPVTWEPSTYTSEPVSTIPVITQVKRVEVPIPAEKPTETLEMSEEEPALNEMQSAWKEWFENRREFRFEEQESEPAVKEETEPEIDEEAVELSIQRIQEPVIEREAEQVPIKKAPEPIVTISPPIQRKAVKPRRQKNTNTGVNMIMVALLIVLAGTAVAIALINTGYANQYLNDNPVVKFLGGTSTITK